MSYEYRIVTETLYHEEIGYYKSAGIELIMNDGISSQRIDFISDVSTDFKDVHLLIELMNRVHLSPTMFRKIVDDVFFS